MVWYACSCISGGSWLVEINQIHVEVYLFSKFCNYYGKLILIHLFLVMLSSQKVLLSNDLFFLALRSLEMILDIGIT